MSGKNYGFLAAAVSGAMFFAAVGQGATVAFQNGLSNAFVSNYSGTQDTELFGYSSSLGDWNSGATTALQIGGDSHGPRPALIQFGGLNVMAGQYSTITSAQLILTQEGNGTTAGLPNISAYQMSDGNAGWNQGTQDISVSGQGPATAGDATWNHKAYPSTNWAGGGDFGTGTNYTTLQSTVSVSLANPTETTYTWNILPATIEHWITDTNAGLALTSDNYTSYWDFYSSDVAEKGVRPQLVINYTPVPEPMSGALLLIGGGLLAMRRRRK
jgi:hypothetical protein